MRDAESVLLGALGPPYSSAILLLLLRQYYHKRGVSWANWSYMWVLATYRMSESPHKMTCIIACTPGFHSTDLKLQKRGVATMPILVAKRQEASVKRFQVTGTFLIAHA